MYNNYGLKRLRDELDKLIEEQERQFANRSDFYYSDEHCLVRAFFEEENKKPPHLRNGICMISCPCSRCSITCVC